MKSTVAVQQVSGVDIVATPEVLKAYARAAEQNSRLSSDTPFTHSRARSVVRDLNLKAVRTIFKGAMRLADMSQY